MSTRSRRRSRRLDQIRKSLLLLPPYGTATPRHPHPLPTSATCASRRRTNAPMKSPAAGTHNVLALIAEASPQPDRTSPRLADILLLPFEQNHRNRQNSGHSLPASKLRWTLHDRPFVPPWFGDHRPLSQTLIPFQLHACCSPEFVPVQTLTEHRLNRECRAGR